MTRALALLAAALALAACGGASGAGPQPSLFAYDASAPLGLALGETTSYGDVVQTDLTFTGAGGERIAAWFVHPPAGGPWPLVIWSPGSGGGRDDQVPDAFGLARRGAASLLADPPAARLIACSARADLEVYRRYVVDRRREVDVAGRLADVDATRIAAAGFSFGSSVTGTLAGVEHRIRAFAIQSGRGHHTGFLRTACARLGKKRLAGYLAKLEVLDPVQYVGSAAPAALLFQNGTADPLTPKADVVAYFKAASEPKELRWYRTAHALSTVATTDRDAWLLRQLAPRAHAATAPPVRAVEVGEGPFALAWAAGALWVANHDEGTVVRVDPPSGKVLARIDVGGGPWGLAFDGTALWVGNDANGTVARIDVATNRVASRVKVGVSPIGIAAGGGSVYAADFRTGAVTRIDAATGAIVRTARVGGSHEAAVLDGGSLWVPSEEGELARLDPETLRVTGRLRVGHDPDFAERCGAALWVSNYRSPWLWKVDPRRARVLARIRIGRGAQGMACVAGRLWVANYDRDTLTERDSHGRTLRTIRAGAGPRAVLTGGGHVWVANSQERTVTEVTP